MKLSTWGVIIPARLESSRLPRKLLQDLGGKPILIRVWENLAPLREAGTDMIVATDSPEIMDVCKQFGIPSVLTSPDHPSGTSRCIEVLELKQWQYCLNVQGDEPFVHVPDLLALCHQFQDSPEAGMGTLRYESDSAEEFFDANAVKVVGDPYALYFSRAPIPWPRDFLRNQGKNSAVSTVPPFFTHVGVYVYDRNTLLSLKNQQGHDLQYRESLEQLTPLNNGVKILLVTTEKRSIGIDTIEDLDKARKHLQETSNP